MTRPDPVFAFTVAAVLIAVAGLRYRVGTDYMAYYRTRVTDWQTVWDYLIHFREPGIRLLSKISTMILDDGATLIFICSIIIIGIYSLMIYRYSPMYLVSVLIFLFFGRLDRQFQRDPPVSCRRNRVCRTPVYPETKVCPLSPDGSAGGPVS